jgi:hypothetical protein
MGAGPLILSWINEICSGDTEKRALLVAMANDLAYVVQAVVSTWRERREGPKKVGADMDMLGAKLCMENDRVSGSSQGIHVGCRAAGSAE